MSDDNQLMINDESGLAVTRSGGTGGGVEIAKSKAAQEVQASLVIAKRFPRDESLAYNRIIESCKRLSLADVALYSYPRGGTNISGPSIRLAEVLAQSWGNIDCGVRELERRGKNSLAESYCWDLETNFRVRKEFEVPHEIKAGGRMKQLTDQRDVYELVANNGARRLRACILSVIPRDITDAAVKQVKATIAAGDGKEPLIDRTRKMVVAFKEHFGVTIEMIEKKLGHKLDQIDSEEFVELFGIYNILKDKGAKRGDFFDFPKDDTDGKAAELAEKLEGKGDNGGSKS